MLQRCAIFIFTFFTIACIAGAQELDPRAYQPAPVGYSAFILSYAHSYGDIVFDPSFPIKNVNASLNLEGAAYYRTIDMYGRFSNLTVAFPYALGHISGEVGDTTGRIYRSGLGDVRIRFAINVKGTPAMTLREFLKKKQKTNIGLSFTLSTPTGQYDSAKLINIGQNRWAFKPEIGLSRLFGRWQLDAYGGAWFFSANHDLFGKTQTQAPVASLQFHLTYNLSPRLWFGFDSNFYAGGRTTLDGVESPVVQKNSRIGMTVSVPVARNQSVKFSASRGAFITRGGNFTTIGASYNISWLSR